MTQYLNDNKLFDPCITKSINGFLVVLLLLQSIFTSNYSTLFKLLNAIVVRIHNITNMYIIFYGALYDGLTEYLLYVVKSVFNDALILLFIKTFYFKDSQIFVFEIFKDGDNCKLNGIVVGINFFV